MHDGSTLRVPAMAKVLYAGDMSKETHNLLVSLLEGYSMVTTSVLDRKG